MSAQEVGVYTMILCRIYESSGPIEYNPMRLATYCGMRQATFDKTFEKLVDLGKLSMVGGIISNDRADIEISKRADDLKNNSKAGKASAEKRQQNQQNISTTVQQLFNHTDTDTDTDTVKGEAKASQKKPRACRLSDDWFLPQAWGEWALSQGCEIDMIRIEADKFKDYWIGRAGSSASKLDWLATWRNWIRTAKEKPQANGSRNGTTYHQPTPQGRGDRVDPALANILRLSGAGPTPGDGRG